MLSSNRNVLLPGFFVTNATIGYCPIAEKIVFAIWSLLSVFWQVIYPPICRLAQQSYERVWRFLRITFAPLLAAIIVVTVGIYRFADEIIGLVVGTARHCGVAGAASGLIMVHLPVSLYYTLAVKQSAYSLFKRVA